VVPPLPVRGNDEFPDPERPLVFDDSRPLDRVRSHGPAEEPAGFRVDRAQRHALDSMNRRPKRLTSVLIVGAVVLLIVVLAFVGSKRSPDDHGHSAADSASTAGADHPSSSSSSSSSNSDPSSHSGTRSTGARSGTKSTKTKTTPTTQPTEIVALRSTSTSATYPVVTASYRVTVTATGPIWVAASSVLSGSTLWAGVMQPGAVQVIRATGTIAVQLGTPSVSLAVDKVPVIFPPTMHAPFVATFQPTAAATASAAASAAAAAGAQAAGSTTTTVATAPTGSTSSP
jgi:cytoskeletal protein RodZ